jgi:error-prone DNA polymerase
MCVIKGMSEESAKAIEAARAKGPVKSVPDLVRRISASIKRQRLGVDLHKLAAADAFQSLGLDRRAALWEVRGYSQPVPAMFAGLDPVEPTAPLPDMNEQQQVTSDYQSTGLSLRGHPVSFYREQLSAEGVVPAAALREMQHGDELEVAGFANAYQRPQTAGGVTFITLEDETGVANLVVYKDFFEANRKVLLASRYLAVRGKLERQGDVIHVKVDGVRSLDEYMPDTKQKSRRFH